MTTSPRPDTPSATSARVALAALALAAATTLPARAQTIPLYPGAQYAVGDGPVGAVAVDLDEDGRLDLAFALNVPGTLVTLRGDGYGAFTPPVAWPVDAGVFAIAAGDVDGDGHADLVVAGFADTVVLRRGDGRGALLAPVSYPVGLNPLHVAMADLDGDGLDDVVTADSDSDTVSVLRADGAGGLLPAVALAAAGAPSRVRAADLDGDGALDLLIALVDGEQLGVRLGDGGGGFGPLAQFPVGDQPVDLDVSDLDGDGLLDVVTANATEVGRHLSVLHGDGAGGFGPPAFVALPYINGLGGVALGDVTGDGLTDAVAVDGGFLKGAWVLPGDGTGGFGPATRLEVGAVVADVLLADVDGDCRADVVTSDHYGDAATVLLGGPGGPIAEATSDLPGSPLAARAGDVDDDGQVDLVAALRSPTQGFVVCLGDGAGGLAPLSLHPTALQPDGLALGEVSGDGALDVVAFRSVKQEVWLFAGDGAGGLGPQLSVPIGAVPWAVTTGDLDGDGDDDVVATTMKAGAGNLVTLLANGNGGTGHQFDHAMAGKESRDLRLADLDGDGDLDAVTADGGTDTLTVLPGQGDGTFGAATVLSSPGRPVAVAIGDVDGDGDADLVAAHELSGQLRVFLGNGAGAFVPAPGGTLPVGSDARTVAIADVDGDGLADLVAGAHFISESRAVVFLGTGGGGFAQPAQRFATGSGPVALEVLHLDADGRPELVSANEGANTVSILGARLPPAEDPWMDYGCGLAGAGGVPALDGSGTLQPSTPGALTLAGAAPLAPAALFFAIDGVPAAFKGGLLRPVPPLLVVPLATDGTGALALPFLWPGGVPGGIMLAFQIAVADGGGPAGAALSNALCVATP